MAEVPKRMRVTGTARSTLGADLRTRYETGASIRDLMLTYGRSYGFIHQMLTESGTVLRQRGGLQPRRSGR
ncbi:MAG: helix-turn-helix domain-containing protein [Actinomycetota bacterium]|nr:helix-turn-helix domain-containing protein [Actinomycetota bacterium]